MLPTGHARASPRSMPHRVGTETWRGGVARQQLHFCRWGGLPEEIAPQPRRLFHPDPPRSLPRMADTAGRTLPPARHMPAVDTIANRPAPTTDDEFLRSIRGPDGRHGVDPAPKSPLPRRGIQQLASGPRREYEIRRSDGSTAYMRRIAGGARRSAGWRARRRETLHGASFGRRYPGHCVEAEPAAQATKVFRRSIDHQATILDRRGEGQISPI